MRSRRSRSAWPDPAVRSPTPGRNACGACSPTTRSGLTLVLVSSPGAAAAIAQAIDESGFEEQVGTLAGDNTLLVLFADEPALERWRTRLATFARAAAGIPADDLTSTYP